MKLRNYCLAGLAVPLTIWATAIPTRAADDGLITKPSRYSVNDTIARFEAAIKEREKDGLMVFTEIDHAAAAKKFGLELRARTVILFGVPKRGTAVMAKTPLVAIDFPPKALVWEDDQGKVWLSYNSADYLFKTIYPRHGAEVPPTPLAARQRAGGDQRLRNEIGWSPGAPPTSAPMRIQEWTLPTALLRWLALCSEHIGKWDD